jgi:hypothetical protein
MPENFGVVRANQEREQFFCGKEDIDRDRFRDYF